MHLVLIFLIILWPLSGYAAGKRHLHALLKPAQQTTLSAEISAKILHMPFKEGDTFPKEAILVQFDCSEHHLNLQRSYAYHQRLQHQLENHKKLLELKAISPHEMVQSQSSFNQSQINLHLKELMIKRCTIYAPFSGYVAQWKAFPHQSIKAGQPLIHIMDRQHLEIEMHAPSRWLSWLKPGVSFFVHIQETNQLYPAKIVRLGAQIDTKNELIKVIGIIRGAFPELIPGMGGKAALIPQKQ
ncbi:efflux RND transporter periplasmic adaptor subunit [Magnetococcales bacterium HHB-1]